MDRPSIYLDYAAATPLDPVALEAMMPYLTKDFYNPSANYLAAANVKKALETARSKVAHWLGSKPSEVVFTAGATEANNMAIYGLMSQYPEANIVISAIEHDSVRVPAKKYDYREVRVDGQGRLDLEDLKSKIDERTVLVSVMYANNEIGTVQSLSKVAEIVEKVRQSRRGKSQPIFFHSDAAQAGNYLDLHIAKLGVDLMSLNGGKLYGPKQSGVLYIKSSVQLEPLISGGGQERNLRSGTENVAGAVGLSEALNKAQSIRRDETMRLQLLQEYFINKLKANVPGLSINGSIAHRLPNNVHISLAGKDNERLLMELDERGIQAAAGSACSASSEEPSHVLRAIGMTDEEAQSSLRLTTGRFTTQQQLDEVIRALRQLV